jgi:hypothetical protein
MWVDRSGVTGEAPEVYRDSEIESGRNGTLAGMAGVAACRHPAEHAVHEVSRTGRSRNVAGVQTVYRCQNG